MHELKIIPSESPSDTNEIEILGERVENSRREVLVLKARQAYHAYRDMLHYHGVKDLLGYLNENSNVTFDSMRGELQGERETNWVNLGGQLIPSCHMEDLKEKGPDNV